MNKNVCFLDSKITIKFSIIQILDEKRLNYSI